jgi:CxxC motif-containing protein (DUF1111 family)
VRARRLRLSAVAIGTIAAVGCGDDGEPPTPAAGVEAGEELSGGDTTVFDTTRDAFARPAKNLSNEHRDEFSLGDHFFNRNWVTAPASASGNDGLGPTYNATSCSACHFKDGRGAPPETPDEDWLGLLMRISIPGAGDHGEPVGEPTYGGQLNPFSILGVPAEGRASVVYEEVAGTFGDGEPFSLRRPLYSFEDLAFGPMVDVLTSPRIAQAMPGLGLLEAISEETVLALADEDDADGDGISGRPNRVWDERRQATVLGRFGWKANQSTVEQQVAGAFLGDIGITTSMFPSENCTAAQPECEAATNGGTPELDDQKLRWVSHYAMTLAVPARRDWKDGQVVRGKELFSDLGCASCHSPKLVTGTLEGFPELSNQIIRPYTDLLLHDMGEGLATDRPEFDASGSEWRTAPLWGIGLVETVNRHEYLLHDGRARGFVEAILWHGGEAEGSREAFRNLARVDRDAVVRFLESL